MSVRSCWRNWADLFARPICAQKEGRNSLLTSFRLSSLFAFAFFNLSPAIDRFVETNVTIYRSDHRFAFVSPLTFFQYFRSSRRVFPQPSLRSGSSFVSLNKFLPLRVRVARKRQNFGELTNEAGTKRFPMVMDQLLPSIFALYPLVRRDKFPF